MKDTILGKYHFPILRFGTNESNEKVKLVKVLKNLLGNNNNNNQDDKSYKLLITKIYFNFTWYLSFGLPNQLFNCFTDTSLIKAYHHFNNLSVAINDDECLKYTNF